MRIRVVFFLPATIAAKVRARWEKLRSQPGETAPGSRNPRLVVVANEALDAANLERLLQEFAPASASWQVRRFADYSADDLAAAELLQLEVASFDDAAGSNALRRRPPCPRCGSVDYWGETSDSKPPLIVNPRTKDLDLWWMGRWLVVSERLAQRLAACSGAVFERVPAVKGLGEFCALRGQTSLGYPSDGTIWQAPCVVCGLRDGTAPPRLISSLPRYPRSAWNGDDVVGGAETHPGACFCLSQAAWQLLTSEKWRTPTDEIAALPVQLEPDQEPIR